MRHFEQAGKDKETIDGKEVKELKEVKEARDVSASSPRSVGMTIPYTGDPLVFSRSLAKIDRDRKRAKEIEQRLTPIRKLIESTLASLVHLKLGQIWKLEEIIK